MYDYAFTYVPFYSYLLEFIYLKLDLFSMLQCIYHVIKYYPTFFLTNEYLNITI